MFIDQGGNTADPVSLFQLNIKSGVGQDKIDPGLLNRGLDLIEPQRHNLEVIAVQVIAQVFCSGLPLLIGPLRASLGQNADLHLLVAGLYTLQPQQQGEKNQGEETKQWNHEKASG